jgi:sec-independent protein translocase protein TatC
MAEKRLTIGEHLDELRRRLLYSCIVFIVVLAVCFFFQEKILQIVVAPHLKATNNDKLWPIEYAERFLVYFKSCLIATLALSGPFILYQLWKFIGAGLYPREKKYVLIYLPLSIALFTCGILFCYFIFLPPLLQFLAAYGDAAFLQNKYSLGNYFDLFIMMIIILGLVFELPLVMLFFAHIGLITPKFYWSKFKLWILLAFIIAAVITPTGDPINQTFLAVPLILLYIIGILLSYLALKIRNIKGTEKV